MRRWTAVIFWLVVLGAVSCKDASPHGGLMLVFRSNLIAGKDFSTIRVQILRDDKPVFDQSYPVGKGHELPATLAVVGKDAAQIVTVRAAAVAADGKVRTVREAITTIPDQRIAVLEMYLDWLCVGKVKTGPNGPESDCELGKTCSAGTCVDAHQGVDGLPDFQSDSVLGVGGPATTCFDVLACFARSSAVSVDSAACSFAAPQGVSTINVGLLLPFQPDSAGICDGATRCIVPLEANSATGFQQKSGLITLAREICTRLAAGAIEGVVVSLDCPSKSSTLPICGDGVRAVLDASSEMATTPTTDASVDARPVIDAGVGESGPTCVPLGPTEDCYNGVDDDCNGQVDCEDVACQPTTECVEDAPAPFVPGVQRLGAVACPADYATVTPLVGSITGAGCACGCATHSVSCNMTASFYMDAGSCATLGNSTLPDKQPTNTCQQAFISVPSVFGVNLSMSVFTPCTVDKPVGDKVPYSSMGAKFCAPMKAGGGCMGGAKCLPKQPSHCALAPGKVACPSSFPVGSTWYKGVSDTRTCGACTCSVMGANCNAYGISYGTDFGCPPTTGTLLGPGAHCFPSSYAPGYQLAGTPTDGVCAGVSAQSGGKLEGTEEQTLCCR